MLRFQLKESYHSSEWSLDTATGGAHDVTVTEDDTKQTKDGTDCGCRLFEKFT